MATKTTRKTRRVAPVTATGNRAPDSEGPASTIVNVPATGTDTGTESGKLELPSNEDGSEYYASDEDRARAFVGQEKLDWDKSVSRRGTSFVIKRKAR